MTSLTIKDELTEFLLYTTPNSDIKVEIYMYDETVWLPQKAIAELFGVQRPAITKHLKNIFESGELEDISVSSVLEHTANDGKNYQIKHYNLDAILSVGYRVNSSKATQFRIWATKILKEFIIKGFAMDDDRMKNGRYFGKDYFKELLEIIYGSADKTKPFMGLQTWKNSPDGRVLKSDTIVAKNYLSEEDIKELESAISGYFDYIERIIKNHTTLSMKSLIKHKKFNQILIKR